jgi:GR25 family glycosyltransferase involved in LPS biosynthesis
MTSVYYINLDRRKDRRTHFESQVPWAVRVRAREGLEDGTRSLFDPAVTLKTGEYGCAASHVDVWRLLAASNNASSAFVFEDDANLSKDFEKTFGRLEIPGDAEIVFVSYSDYTNGRTIVPLILSEQKATLNQRIFFDAKVTRDVGHFKSDMDPCTTGYWMTRDGARNLLRHVQTNPIDRPIDHYVNAYLKAKGIFYGLLVALATPAEGLGTDVQTVMESDVSMCAMLELSHDLFPFHVFHDLPTHKKTKTD